MIFPTLTHEFRLYLPLIFLFLVLGNFTTSYLLHRSFRYFSSRSILKTANALHCFLFLMGLTFLPFMKYLSATILAIIYMALVGVGLGYLFFRMEITLYRIFFRKWLSSKIQKNDSETYKGAVKIDHQMSYLTSEQLDHSQVQSKVEFPFSNQINFELGDLMVAAIIEEGLYRGLFQSFLISYMPDYLWVVSVLLSSFIFGIIHFNYGWQQLMNKWVMGIVLGFSVLLTHTLYVAFAAHMCFNILTYRHCKQVLQGNQKSYV